MHKIEPFEISEPDRYSRLFRPADSVISVNDSRLKCLAWSMRDKKIPKQSGRAAKRLIPAGYTYFGQFIDHDMTFEDFTLLKNDATREPRDTPNLRRNWLNLDSLYGAGPGATRPEIYGDDGASFQLGGTFDVPLDGANKPVVAEPRNLSNAIVRQLHAMFLKLHNLAVSYLPSHLPPPRRFFEARRRVRHQYQWLVRNDFLPRICESATYNSILDEPMFEWHGRFSIPIEFARAAFRFGHSMVRREYDLRGNNKPIPLRELFGHADLPGALVQDHAVPWTKFLHPFLAPPEFAVGIDTSIVAPLFHIPKPSVRPFRVGLSDDSEIVPYKEGGTVPPDEDGLALAHVTLQRGAASRLLTGQAARAVLNAGGITSENLRYDPWSDLKKYCLQEQTPLWYYVLLEAEVNGKGTCLGPVGSRIVGEVIEGALWANKDSCLRCHGRCWKPDPWMTENGPKQIETLHDVAIVVGLAD